MREWKERNNIPSLQPTMAPTMVLIFSLAIFWSRRYYSGFFWIICPSQTYPFSLCICLSSSFSSFRIFSAPYLALIRSIPPTLFHSLQTSHPLSFSLTFSPLQSVHSVSVLHLSFIFWRCCRVGLVGVRVAGSTSYPICVSIMRSCPLNPGLIHQPGFQPAKAASSRHPRNTHTPHHWQMAVRRPDTYLLSSQDHSACRMCRIPQLYSTAENTLSTQCTVYSNFALIIPIKSVNNNYFSINYHQRATLLNPKANSHIWSFGAGKKKSVIDHWH